MSNLYRNIGLAIVFLYILGIFAVGYYALHNVVEARELMKKMPLMGILVIITTFLGLIAFIFLFLGSSEKALEEETQNEATEAQNATNEAQNNNLDNKKTQVKLTLDNIFSDTTHNQTQILDKALKALCQQLEISIGVIYHKKNNKGENNQSVLEMISNYALYQTENHITSYNVGEGLVGQVAKNGKLILIDDVPSDYLSVVSGLGKSKPAFLLILPIQNTENEILGAIELASFKTFTEEDIQIVEEMGQFLAKEFEMSKV